MAAKKKPAIANVARPEGFIDDVVLPLAQKATRAVGYRGLGKVVAARGRSYGSKAIKAYSKSDKAVSGRAAERQMKKANVLAAKSSAALRAEDVRKAANKARKNNKQTFNTLRKSYAKEMRGLR